MSGNYNYSTSMNEHYQDENYQDEDYQNEQNSNSPPKWSVRMFGRNIPYWIIVIFVLIIVYLIYSYSNTNKSIEVLKLQGTANDALNINSTLSSPTSSMNMGTSASINVAASEESTKKLQRELRELFSKY
jgi:hypothetical protein